jgi:hypothetical protein
LRAQKLGFFDSEIPCQLTIQATRWSFKFARLFKTTEKPAASRPDQTKKSPQSLEETADTKIKKLKVYYSLNLPLPPNLHQMPINGS